MRQAGAASLGGKTHVRAQGGWRASASEACRVKVSESSLLCGPVWELPGCCAALRPGRGFPQATHVCDLCSAELELMLRKGLLQTEQTIKNGFIHHVTSDEPLGHSRALPMLPPAPVPHSLVTWGTSKPKCQPRLGPGTPGGPQWQVPSTADL